MHICSILTSFTGGGAETIVANLSGAFVRTGARSTVLTLCDADQVGNCQDMERSIIQRIASEGATARSLSLANRRNLLVGAIALRKFLAETKPDIIHAHTAQALPMIWLARAKIPIFFTHHNSRLSFPPALFLLFNRMVDGYVAISSGCADLLRLYVRKPVTLIHNIAGEGFDVTIPRNAPRDAVTILCVGAISAQKDYPTLVRAAALLRDRMGTLAGGLRIRVAGGGPQLEQLRALAHTAGVGEIVEFLGPRSDVPELMAKADLFVNSSLYEGLPVAIIEAMKAALPVVATQVPGNCELVRSGETGTLVSSQDPVALASAIAEILGDAPTYEAMSRAAQVASAQYCLSTSTLKHIEMYRHALKDARASSPVQEQKRSTGKSADRVADGSS